MDYAAILGSLGERGRLDGQPFLIGPDGRPDARVNAFFASPRMRARSPLTWRKYSQSVGMWLNFLHALGRPWDEATEADAEYFKEWRLTESSNPDRVEGSTFGTNLIALRMFYRWVSPRFGIDDPVAAVDDFDLMPRSRRQQKVKWLDPAGYRRWRDLGLRGMGLDGRRDESWRGRNEQRDSAFADGLYGTGLRLTEWASVVLSELPDDDPARGYSTCMLADACAKGGYGHRYWLPRPALLDVLDYVEGARARLVRQAQRAGRYDELPDRRLVVETSGRRLVIVEPDGRQTNPALNAIGPRERRKLFRETAVGLEPLALWLNEDGLPFTPHSWQHVFSRANSRIAALGLKGFSATPHMLRDSCALRWYSVGRLAYERRLAHLSEDETKDFRQQFGDTWDLVATYLGHRNPETTKMHYLEPFRALDVEILLQHAKQAAVETFLASYLADHPLVRTDPIREVS
jgi:site-specific recombinase XerD